jgi:hypothetical protein
MFVVPHAGKLYGPFETADKAAIFAEALIGPWHIAPLHDPDAETPADEDQPAFPFTDAPTVRLPAMSRKI